MNAVLKQCRFVGQDDADVQDET